MSSVGAGKLSGASTIVAASVVSLVGVLMSRPCRVFDAHIVGAHGPKLKSNGAMARAAHARRQRGGAARFRAGRRALVLNSRFARGPGMLFRVRDTLRT